MSSSAILVCCGSFNPPTIAHLRLMEMAREHVELFGLKVVKGFYSAVNDGYAKENLISGKHRVSMLRASVQKSSWLDVHEWEVRQPGWVTTASVLKQIKDEYPECRVILVAGSDILRSFNVTGLWDEDDVSVILGPNHGLVIIERASVKSKEIIELMLDRPIIYKSQKNIWFVNQPIVHKVSSTKVRQLLQIHCNIRYLVPDSVYDYILSNKLYQ